MKAGDRLGNRYVLDAPLGEGGMGEVWRGTDTQLVRAVAIKVLLPHATSRPEAVLRFQREARVGAALQHPHVVHTLDFGHYQGRHYLVLELVTGGNLLDYRLAHAPLSLDQIYDFGAQIADALAAAHAIGLVHRDLKPENVLLDGTTLRLADFGMAFLTAPADPLQGRLTEDGALGGTPEYMAPEQVDGGNPGPPADIYALGCLLFELATGDPPFFGGGIGRLFASHLYAHPPKVRERRPDLPPGFEELVQRMLAKVPGERPTAEAVRRRLVALAGGSPVVSDRPERMVEASPAVPAPDGETIARVGVVGALDRDSILALSAVGVEVARADEPVDARIIVGGSLDQVAQLCAGGGAVIADAAREDFHRIQSLLKLGVAEVIFTPLAPAGVVKKVLRALRRRPS
ncbi:MAG TPA: protein kinase [Kofleriaceae bacterium]